MPEPSPQGGLLALVRRFFRWVFGRTRRRAGSDDGQRPARDPQFALANYSLQPDTLWLTEGKFPLDARLRVALAQLKFGNTAQIKERTGIDVTASGGASQGLQVFVELNVPLTDSVRSDLQNSANLHIASAYLHDAALDPSLRVFPAVVEVSMRGALPDAEAARASVRAIVDDDRVGRLELAPLATASLEPCRNETLDDFDLPVDRKIEIGGKTYDVTGKGVVIGIIDDGCALAHWNFLSAKNRSRIRYLWDQSTDMPLSPPPGYPWAEPGPATNYGGGRELVNIPGTGPIDAALAACTNAAGVIDENAVYTMLDFPAVDAVSHGSHVMDIAAGNGKGISARAGVAPEAEIIFVQLPPGLVETGGAALFKRIADGADYVFNRAKDLEAQLGHAVPAVVNVSFANHLGPHDGTTPTEIRFEDMLKFDDRAIVLAAGNGFAAGCHTTGLVNQANSASLQWVVSGGDESVNSMEIWYTNAADLEFYITPPASSAELGPVKAGDPRLGIYNPAAELIGYVDHVGSAASLNGDSQITVTINGTLAYPGSAPLAPAGIWTIRLVKPNAGAANVYHAWIEHDEARRGSRAHRSQSRFVDAQADPTHSISGTATGASTIAVGAYNTATDQVAEYSACGPTRAATKVPGQRRKPELCAPCASDARGRGTLSAATRFQLPTRMAGTSASAPHVAGLAALILQLNRDVHHKPLPVKKLRELLEKGAKAGGRPLRPNAHQQADANQPRKQSDAAVWPHLTGWGRTDAKESLKRV